MCGRKPSYQHQLDQSIRFNTVAACDRHTQTRRAIGQLVGLLQYNSAAQVISDICLHLSKQHKNAY